MHAVTVRLTTVTSLNHQPEAQHPKSSAIHKNAGRLPHLLGEERTLACGLLGANSAAARPDVP
jgi:hypothetical protein